MQTEPSPQQPTATTVASFLRHTSPVHNRLCLFVAIFVPLAYLFLYTPYGMDSTDFGFFYGYSWRILQGEIPYRDFYYINPPVPIFWHALWMGLTPEQWNILGGKAGFVVEMLAAAWLGTLALNRVFDLTRLGERGVPVSLLATTAFVWGVHSFPHMPWHTVDGVFFASAALCAGAFGLPVLAGLLAILSMLCKQSYLFIPFGVAVFIFFLRPRKRETLFYLIGAAFSFGAYWFLLHQAGAWEDFVRMTSAPLEITEAIDAGILIYLRQPWWLPALAAVPWLIWRFALKKALPQALQPVLVYVAILAVRYIYKALSEQRWIGYGESWPMLLVVLGGLCVLFPGPMLRPWLRPDPHKVDSPLFLLRGSVALGAALLVSWSAGISGGYKVPVFFAVPLIFTLLIIQARLGGKPLVAAWVILLLGLIMFRAGYEYPYVYPQRPMPRASLTLNAGEIFPKASGVYVDQEMYERLQELRQLREKYGPNYKTLPGFPLAYYINGDRPAFPCEWVTDWAINNEWEKVYQLLIDKDIVVFMERDQMDIVNPDAAYARTRYSVSHKVRTTWHIVEETSHFVVMRP